jgi:hypothetical protein
MNQLCFIFIKENSPGATKEKEKRRKNKGPGKQSLFQLTGQGL